MTTEEAAERWARVWEACWRAQDIQAIAALYAQGATYRSHPFRAPEASPADYVTRAFADERDPQPRFGPPIVQRERAAVEWWCTVVEAEVPVTLAGCTVLRFDGEGQVTEHQDYWHLQDGFVRDRPSTVEAG